MAGSRVHKIGTIFSRTTGLLRSGAMKIEDKPLWYDVYEAFPPKLEPNFIRPASKREIPNIFYKEDIIRAQFYKEFGSPGIVDMSNERTKSLSQRFLDKYMELENTNQEGDVFDATVEALVSEGVTLTREEKQVEIDISQEPFNAPIFNPAAENSKT